MGLKERRKKIMALMLAACVAGTSIVPVAAADISAFSDGEFSNMPEVSDSVNVDSASVATTKKVNINFYCPEEKRTVDEPELEVAKDAETVEVSSLKVPAGYELTTTAQTLAINDGSVYAEVRQAATTKKVKINFYCPEEKRTVDEPELEVAKDAETVEVSSLKVPAGYELTTTAQTLAINDGYVYAEVRQAVTTKKITVIYQNRKGKIIDDKDVITVDKNAISVNTGDLTAPKGYTIAITGDITISKNNKVYITVDQNKKAVRIIFKESDKVIDSSKEISVVANAKSVKLSRITAPAGYQIVTTKPNLKISKKNTVTVKVKKLGKTIKVIYRDTTNEIVDTREIVVDKKATSISSNKIPVPAGYEMLTTGSCSVRTGKIDVYVVKR